MQKISSKHVNRRILVVDDDQSITLLIAMMLKRAGLSNVTTVNSGRQALEVMGMTANDDKPDALPFDLILMDIMMPRINGFELCAKVRRVWGDQAAIILVTGYEIENHHARYIESGANDFISKPINPKEFIGRIEINLTRHFSKNPHPQEIDANRIHSELGMSNIGRYRVVRTMSWSGSVVVYEADDDGNKCVVKILTKQAMEYDDVKERFMREIFLLETFDNDNVIKFLDKGVHHDLEYFVTEFIDGTNLEDYLNDNPCAKLSVIYKIAKQMAMALTHVHSKEVIHRDVKLKNMFLDKNGTVKIGDFGIAMTKGDVRLTQQGYAIGTPIYMAPEQFDGGNVTSSVDIYSFGASMYHLTTGFPPFTAGNAMELLRKHLREKPRTMTAFRDDVPDKWDELIVRGCLAKKPEDRPRSMNEVIERMISDKLS